jgi:hypothetical protein
MTSYPKISLRSITAHTVDNVSDAIWEPYTLHFNNYKEYNVYVYRDKKKDIYMKAMERYYSEEFERLFDFGISCKNFDKNKVIKVVRSY